MFKQIDVCVKQLVARNLVLYNGQNTKKLYVASRAANFQEMHTTAVWPNYAATVKLPIPNNIDAAETTRFSPQRSRDISANVLLSHHNQQGALPLDITVDSTTEIMADVSLNSAAARSLDPHVESYDCFGAVSLNSVMQSNVPSPFGGMHKFSHLNMPGGQWSQEGKFMSQYLHSSHYTALREQARSDWVAYDQNAIVNKKALPTNQYWRLIFSSNLQARKYSTKASTESTSSAEQAKSTTTYKPKTETLSKKEQLKRAFKDYGATVIVFHVTISLASLGLCYLLVSGGIDMVKVLEALGISSATLNSKLATGASTFVVAYAIHKVFAPVRISITLGATPFIVRYLRSKGILKAKSVK